MELHEMTHQSFRKLLTSFLQSLESLGYKESTLHNYRRTLAKIQNYMEANQYTCYKSSIGIDYYEDYVTSHLLGESRHKSIITAIRRLNDFVDNVDFRIQHTTIKPVHLPNGFATALSSYADFCKSKGNKELTIKQKARHLEKFIITCVHLGCNDIANLGMNYITKSCISMNNRDSWAVIRDFLRFVCNTSIIEDDFSSIIPKYKREIKLPSTYNYDEITAFENSIDRSTEAGIRDYATLLLATRLSMRSGDIANLTFDSLDFAKSKISIIQQKTGTPLELPMLPIIKEALTDYIENVRPASTSNKIFLRTSAPYQPITTSTLRFATTKYLNKAGVNISGKRHGPHSFRSSMASSMVNTDISYEVVRKILGHEDSDAVKHYAKLDIERLRNCAIEVPSPSGLFKAFLEGRRI